jgi:hypothetical protein
MDRSARLFLCGRCRAQVLLCSHCDRGQHYCGRKCLKLARQDRRREAAQRYQRSWQGRLAHAERSRRWRARQATRVATQEQTGAAKIVTHQGCPAPAAAASLAPCASTAISDAATQACMAPHDPTTLRCRRCRHPLRLLVRQGFVRRGGGREHLP